MQNETAEKKKTTVVANTNLEVFHCCFNHFKYNKSYANKKYCVLNNYE